MNMPLDANGDKYVLNMIDHFTKFVWSKAIPTKDAGPIAKYFLEVLQQEGIAEFCVCDNGSEFRNATLKKILTENGIKELHGLPYCPSTQGVVERVNRTLNEKVYVVPSSHLHLNVQ